MKFVISIIILFLFSACQKDKNEMKQKTNSHTFYIGTYTNKTSEGIYQYSLRDDGMLTKVGLVAKSENPSFLALSSDRKYLLAVNEIDKNGSGTVESYLIKDKTLELISSSSSGGAHPCFVALNDEDFILTANYTGGNVGLLKLSEAGELSPILDVQNHSGSGVHKNQAGPHAHSAWFEPFTNGIISVDLGTNGLWFSRLDVDRQKLVPSEPQMLQMEAGAGPRHLVIHPNGRWIYVVNELSVTVTLVIKQDDGTFRRAESVSALPDDYKRPNSCADIHISSDGRFVYASNRGHNSIAIFKVNSENGTLKLVGHQSTHGSVPRNFSLSPDDNFLLVANQQTDTIVSFKRDRNTGLLDLIDQIEAPTPVCILF